MDFGDDMAADGNARGLGSGGNLHPGRDTACPGQVNDGNVQGAGVEGLLERVKSVQALAAGHGDVQGSGEVGQAVHAPVGHRVFQPDDARFLKRATRRHRLEIWPESGGSRVSGYTWSQQA